MSDAGDMNLGWESVKGFLGKMVQAVLGFAGTIIFARALGPTGFGGFYLLLSIVELSDRPMRGVAQAVRKRYSEVGADREGIVGATLLFDAAFFVVAGVLVGVFRRPLVTVTGIEDAPLVFMALLVSISIFFPFQQMLAAEGWLGKQTWNDTLRSVLTLPLQVGFVLAGFGAAGMGYGLAAASVLVVPVSAYFLGLRPAVPSRETLDSMWEYARYSTPTAFVGKTYDRFDTLLIGGLLSAGVVAQYEVAMKLTLPATFLFTVVASGLMPKVSNLHSRGEDVSADVTNAISYVSLFAIPIFFGTLAIPKRLVVTVYGPQYTSASLLLVGLALYQVARSQSIIQRKTIDGIDRPDIGFRIDVVTLALNIVVGVALLLEYGAVGVVAATVLAESLRYVLSATVVSRQVPGVTFLPKALGYQVLAGVAMFAVVELAATYVPGRSVLHVAVVVGVGAVVYLATVVAISRQLRFTLLSVYKDARA